MSYQVIFFSKNSNKSPFWSVKAMQLMQLLPQLFDAHKSVGNIPHNTEKEKRNRNYRQFMISGPFLREIRQT